MRERCGCLKYYNGILPDDILMIVAGYIHRGPSVRRAIVDEINRANRESPFDSQYSQRTNSTLACWIFEANCNGETYANMNYRNDVSNVSDIALQIAIAANSNELNVFVGGNSIYRSFPTYSTIFSRENRRRFVCAPLDYIDQDITTGPFRRFDVVCDLAHESIMRWYHFDQKCNVGGVSRGYLHQNVKQEYI